MIRKNRYTSVTHLEDIDLYIVISVMQFMSLPINVSIRHYTSDSENV